MFQIHPNLSEFLCVILILIFQTIFSGLQIESLEGYLIVVNSWLNDEDIYQQIKDIYLIRYFAIINSLISCHSSFVLGIVIFPLS